MLKDTVVIEGEVSLISQIDGDPSLLSEVDGDPNVIIAEGMTPTYPHYSGSYTVTPSGSVQVLDTSDTIMDDDVTVEAIQAGSATTPATIITADPTISVSSGGLITATVSKTQQITPTVVEGYVETGTPGNVGVSGSAVQQLTTQGAQTIHPASTDQSIASGKYLTGAQTFKAVTVSGLTADKVLQGNVVKIGDSDDDDRIMSVTGTASGGITPTGTKSITANGTGIDVYSYQYADVAVPNSYSASDEGKVVSNGALVAQTSDTVTANDTYDTTLINSLTVNVSGGGGESISDFITNQLTTYSSNDITWLSRGAFYYKTSLEEISLPNCTSFGRDCFNGLSKLTKLYLPKAQTGLNVQDAVASCPLLPALALPAYNGALSGYCCRSNAILSKLDFGEPSGIGGNAFNGQAALNFLVLRNSSVVSLANVNAFTNTCFASGKTGGTLYVPSSLVSSYSSASNWSTILGYTNNQIKSIESTHTDATAPIDLTLYYADGTLIPTT